MMRGCIVRPLLGVGRADIEAYLGRQGMSYRNDATNFETEYTRNRIRLDILPYVTEHINQAAVSHIAETAAIASDICRYVENQAAAIGKSIIQWNGEAECLTAEIDAAAFVGQDIAIQRELLRQVLERTAGQLKDIRSVHIGTLRALFYGHAGKKADLPYGLRAERTYRTVSVSQKKTHKSAVLCMGMTRRSD